MIQADLPQVNFYVLPKNKKQEHFACALIQKVWKKENNIFISTRSEAEAAALDDLLWTFKDISFLPHCLVADNNAENSPIVIGHDGRIDNHMPEHTAVLLNLTDQTPQNMDKVEKVMEIVAGSEDERQQARKRYNKYRNQGHKLNTHMVES